jgi:hypothetical protein
MFVDRMHSDAIKAADASMLPQTVYRVGNNWFHAEAMWVRSMMRFAPKVDALVVTWLPAGFFN